MSKQVQLRGGTTSEHSTFTGAPREVTVDVTKKTLVVHDGVTAGGVPLATEQSARAYADDVSTNRNIIINGGMRFDQERNGASITLPTTSSYVLDQWVGVSTGANRISAQRVTDAPDGFTNSLIVTSISGGALANTDVFGVSQPLEGLNIAELGFGTASAKPLTLQFWVKGNLTGTYFVALRNGALTHSYVAPYTISTVNTWTKVVINIPAAVVGTWPKDNTAGMHVTWELGAGSNAQTASTNTWVSGNFVKGNGSANFAASSASVWYITGVKLEVGSVATPWTPHWGTWGGEEQAVKRYFWAAYAGVNVPTVIACAAATNPGGVAFTIKTPTQMRATPSVQHAFSDVNFTSSASPPLGTWGVHIAGTSVVSKTGGTWTFGAPSYTEIATVYGFGVTLSAQPTAIVTTNGFNVLTVNARM